MSYAITPTANLNLTLGHITLKTTLITWESFSGMEVHTMNLPYMLKAFTAKRRAITKYGAGKVTVKHLVNYQVVNKYIFA